jgi:hypothetical protein
MKTQLSPKSRKLTVTILLKSALNDKMSFLKMPTARETLSPIEVRIPVLVVKLYSKLGLGLAATVTV